MEVAIRFRPIFEKHSRTKISLSNDTVKVQDTKKNSKQFQFKHVFEDATKQDEVFDQACKKLCHRVLDGFHSTIFAYGQTGAGKTYTMSGIDDQAGVIPRAIDYVFELLNAHPAKEELKVSISMCQIYNEKIYDLLNNNNTDGLRIRWHKRKEFYVENLFNFECKNAEEVMKLFKLGCTNKEISAHNLNQVSSRSHSIFELQIKKQSKGSNYFSKLCLVDLAGSEKLSLLSDAPSEKLIKESIQINRSLLALGKVIDHLSANSGRKSNGPAHVPFRDSILTKLLKHALGGSSYTLLIACINPCDSYIPESLNTLYYASRAKNIQNVPVQQIHPKDRIIAELKKQNAILSVENQSLKNLFGQCFGDSEIYKQLADQHGIDIDGKNKQVVIPSVKSEKKSKGSSKSEKKYKEELNTLGTKFLDSVKMLKQYMELNNSLREEVEDLQYKCQDLEDENLELQNENLEIRDKMNILESLVLSQQEQRQKVPENPSIVPDSTKLSNMLSNIRQKRMQVQKENLSERGNGRSSRRKSSNNAGSKFRRMSKVKH